MSKRNNEYFISLTNKKSEEDKKMESQGGNNNNNDKNSIKNSIDNSNSENISGNNNIKNNTDRSLNLIWNINGKEYDESCVVKVEGIDNYYIYKDDFKFDRLRIDYEVKSIKGNKKIKCYELCIGGPKLLRPIATKIFKNSSKNNLLIFDESVTKKQVKLIGNKRNEITIVKLPLPTEFK
jgi:hypothetical protein